MAFTDASTTRLAYVAETVPGTTPTTPTFKVLRYTGENLQYEKGTVVSNEIRADRNVADLIEVSRRVTGTADFELSYGTLDDLLEGLFSGTWSSDVLKNGVTRKSFTFEKTFDMATDAYVRYAGCYIGGMTLNLSSQAIATGQISVLGMSRNSATSIITGATYTAANSNPVLNTSSHFASLALSGVSGTPRIRNLSISINNNLREQAEVGAIALAGVGQDRFIVSGNMEVYFEDLNLVNAIDNHTTAGLSFTVGAAAGSKYTFDIGSLKFMTGDPVAGGNGQDVIINVGFQGIYDSTDAATMVITRAVT